MLVLQDKPSSATLRQQALNQALGTVIQGLEGLDQASKTKRAEALALQEQTRKLREQGYDVNEKMVADSMAPEQSGLSKFLANTPIGQSMGFKLQADKPDLYANRTEEYKTKLASDAEDKKFKRKMDETDMLWKQKQFESDQKYKNAQMASMGVDNQKKVAEMNDLVSGNKFKRELTQDQVKKIGEGNAKIIAVKSGIDNALRQLEDPSLSDDAKLKVGQETLKLLNSAEGADAVGSEEAQRLGSKLEFAMGNFFNGNPTQFGRDIPGFAEQLRNNSNRLTGRITDNEKAMSQIMSGKSFSDIAKEGTPPIPGQVALQPLNFRGSNPQVPFSPTNFPNVSPVQSAHAGKPIQIKPHHAQKAQQMSDQELMNYLGLK